MEGEDVRMFRLSVDVRSFKAGLRLPMKAINACVRVMLPPDILKLAMAIPNSANAAKITPPLRTHPPVMVQKGSEVTLSNGYVSLELPASVSGLAAALAQDLCLQAQVFHRDKYAADSLIGTASIPMTSLMKEPWLDGYAPVYSPTDRSGKEGQVTIGMLRVVLSAEEIGPVTTSVHKPIQGITTENGAVSPLPSLEDPFFLLKKTFDESLPSKVVAVQTQLQEDSDEKPRKKPFKEKAERVYKVQSKSKTLKPLKGNQENLLQDPTVISDRAVPLSQADEKLRKFELQWEFERWRHAEEAKWRAGLKDKEIKRMAALDAEWKHKETEHILNIDRTRTELSNLEAKFRAKLFALEKRERGLVIAEEEALLRREAWTRDCTQRAADAEVAVKRLQSECEHRVELEKTKYTALKEQHAVLEKRLAVTNAALADLEKHFCSYKTEHWKSSEAELLGQVMLLKQQCNDLKRNCEQAIRIKNEYKVQVQKLAKELAKLHKQHTQDEANRRAQDRGHLALQSLIEAQARKSEEERLELRQLKEQLERLQMQDNATSMVSKSAPNLAASQNNPNLQSEHKNPNPCSPLLHPHCSSSGVSKDVNTLGVSRGKCLDEAVQVNFSTEEVLLADTLKQGFSSSTHEKDDFDDWLSGEFGLDDVLQPNLGIAIDYITQNKDANAVHMRESLLDNNMMHARDRLDDELKSFDVSFYTSQLSEFQESEIRRLTKQRLDLLQTGVYTEEDRIIKGLDQEIQRLQSVDTKKFTF